jgi:hypothetical protein
MFRSHWVTTVDQSADQVADRIRRLVISEKYFSDRRGEVLFHGVVSSGNFALVPCVIEGAFGIIKPFPIRVQGHIQSTDRGAKIEALAQMTDMFYLAFGLALLALVIMFTYETVLAPELVLAWLSLSLPMVLVLLGVALLYARFRLQTTMRVLQEGVKQL